MLYRDPAELTGQSLDEYTEELEILPGSIDVDATLNNGAIEMEWRFSGLACEKKPLSLFVEIRDFSKTTQKLLYKSF